MPETVSKSIHKWRRYPSAKCYEIDEKMRFWIWRSASLLWRQLTPQRKPQYRCTIPHVHNSPKDVLENLLTVWLLVCTNLFVPIHFWTLDAKFYNCCQRYIATCRRAHTFSALNYCGGTLFIKITKWCAQTFPPIFGLFAIFVRNLRKLWRRLAKEMQTLWQGNPFWKQEAQLMLTTGSTRLLAVSRARAISDGTLT